jgi:arylsulfatase A-like enzyme
VPMVLKGPGIPRGETCREMVSSMDFMPTFLTAAGIAHPKDTKLDGVDLMPYLTRERSGAPHETLCWRNRAWVGPFQEQKPVDGLHNQAIRTGNWKAVRCAVTYGSEPSNQWELYDLRSDKGEQHNVAPEYPEVVKQLDAQYETWVAQMPKPLENA